MLSALKHLTNRRPRTCARRRALRRNIEQLEQRQLLAADVEFSTFFPSTQMEDGVATIAQDSAGNAYVADYRYDAVTFEFESSVSKLSPNGQLLWSQEVPEYALEIAVDDSGFVYLAALTVQVDLPTTADAHQSELAGGTDFHVMVLDGNAIDADSETLSESELGYASYLGGTGTEGQTFIGLATDADGGIYLAGETYSADFPVTSQADVDSSLGGGRDGVVAHFARGISGDYSLSMSSYLGGSEGDRIDDLDVDANGIIHVIGTTSSADFPLTSNAIQTEINNSWGSIGFVTRLTADAEITFSTLLGGDAIRDVVADASGNTYVVGTGGREGFPTTPGAFAPEEILAEDNETRLRGDFASKISPSGELEYSSWFQLSRDVLQIGNDSIALDGDRVVITGMDIGGVDRTSFFIRFDSDFSRLLDYTDVDEQLGNLSWITSSGIIDGSLYVGGATESASFTTTADAINPNKNVGLDGFVRRYSLGERAVGSVSDVTVSEGGVATVTVSLAQPWPTDVAVEYDTLELESRLRPDDYAVAGDDYVAASGTLVIPAGSTSASIDIAVLDDDVLDANEYFQVALTNFDGIGLNATTVTVNIVDDDFSTMDDFDGGVPDGGTGPWASDWDLTGNSAFTSSGSPNDGNLHAIVQRRGVLTRQLDTTDVSNLNLSFASKLRSFENSDNAYVRVSPDGSNWTTLKTFGNGEDDNNYRDHSYDIPFEADTLWIEFEGDMSSSRWDYWYIDTVSVTGEIIPSDPPPTASNDSFATNEDESLSVGAPGVLANDTDPEGQSIAASLVSGPNNGALTLNSDGSFQYTPAPNFNGTDTFTYVAGDGTSESSPATVNISVAAVNDAPEAIADSATTEAGTAVTIDVLANDSDQDGDALTVQSISGPSHGSLTLGTGNSFTYTPSVGFSGSDSFEYRAVDSAGATSQTVAVSLTVTPVDLGPNLSHGELTSVNQTWRTVTLPTTYTSMVVVATPRYNSGSGPGVVRIDNVTSNSFDVRVDNVGSSAFSGGVHYIAVEEGVYDETGFKLEAVKYTESQTSRKNGWVIDTASQGYQQDYDNPVVVGQVMSTHDPDWSVFWASNGSRTNPPDVDGLNVGKHVAEDPDTTRVSETIGYLVIEATQDGTIEGLPFVAGVGSDSVRGVDNGTYQYSYDAMPNAKTAVLSSAGMDGGDGGWAVLRGSNPVPATSGTISLSYDEDQLRDSERKHTTEQVAYFVIDPPVDVEAGPGSSSELTPRHALRVINHLARAKSPIGSSKLDFDQDGVLSVRDALFVINRLTRQTSASATNPPTPSIQAVDAVFSAPTDDDEETIDLSVELLTNTLQSGG